MTHTTKMMNVKTFSHESAFWDSVVGEIKQVAPERMALSGGSSAKVITALKDREFDFSETHLWQTDERFVPHSHSDSNVKLIKDLLGDETTQTHFFSIVGDPKTSAHVYQQELERIEAETLFDVTILGVGPDGHTASLFPESDILDSDNLVEATTTDEFAIRDRLTLTFKALARSKRIIILMMGSSKKTIFETIIDAQTDQVKFPARRLLDWPNVDLYFLDA